MSDPKRATLITVGAPKSAKNNVKKTVRLAINLDESNENKYPELNYKELVIAEERKKKVENGKTTGLDPFSDHDNDMQCVRIFEQKYGGNSTYGQKGRSKIDEFADMGAGYDENDSFIDNTEGYDEMMPPETDTWYGGFYINCGSLEFKGKDMPDEGAASDADHAANRRNKRRISSSSSEEESSESSSESESAEEKDPKVVANGAVDSHKTEHRKKKNKKIENKKAKKVRRTDSSAATSGKQTSDDNAPGDGEGEAESVESGTSQSDSLTSKPAPSSDNPVTSDSSRDGDVKLEVELPAHVVQVLDELEEVARKLLADNPNIQPNDLLARTEQYIIRVSSAVSGSCAGAAARAARARAARALRLSRHALHHLLQPHATAPTTHAAHATHAAATTTALTTAQPTTATTTATSNAHKRKLDNDLEQDYSHLTEEEREAKIVDILQRLKALIEECKPAMIAKYNAECERVHEERKKLQAAGSAGGAVERRMPKRRFPWCARSRGLLGALVRVAGAGAGGAGAARGMLQRRVLPLFPAGFVRMPTLLRQADLSKEMKVSEMKRQRAASTSQPQPAYSEPIQFPSSLTVTTTVITSPNNADTPDDLKYKPDLLSTVLNSFKFNKDLIVEKPDKNDKDLYIPPNNIGSITITPVPNQSKDKKNDKGFIRVKSPAALNEMINKKDKQKKSDKDKNHIKEKSLETPLHIDTSFQTKEPGPKSSEIPQKQIENMRVAESNIPRPALIPVHHSPTFAKPDKRPPEVKKKKDVVIVSDVDPLADNVQEPLPMDDSSSDVEVIEEVTDISDKSEVPSKDKNVQKKVPVIKSVSDERDKRVKTINDDIDIVMRNIREMEHSQEPPKFNSNSFGGVISNAKHEMSSAQAYSRAALFPDARHKKDKFVEPAS